jgi:hypothetical protein
MGILIATLLLTLAAIMFCTVAIKIILLITEIFIVRILLCVIAVVIFVGLLATIVEGIT